MNEMLNKAYELLTMIEEEHTKATIDDNYDLDRYVDLCNMKYALREFISNYEE